MLLTDFSVFIFGEHARSWHANSVFGAVDSLTGVWKRKTRKDVFYWIECVLMETRKTNGFDTWQTFGAGSGRAVDYQTTLRGIRDGRLV